MVKQVLTKLWGYLLSAFWSLRSSWRVITVCEADTGSVCLQSCMAGSTHPRQTQEDVTYLFLFLLCSISKKFFEK